MQEWLKEVDLKYGQRGELHDFVKILAWKWSDLTTEQKEIYHELWLAKGLTETLWLKILAKHNEIMSLVKTQNRANIVVKFETDVFPYPEQQISPVETDYVTEYEALPEPTEPYVQVYWRQQRLSFGNVDYMYNWTETMTDKEVSLETSPLTIPSNETDVNVIITAIIDEPFQNDLEYTKTLSTAHAESSGALKTRSKTVKVESETSNVIIASPPAESALNTSYETEVT